MQRKTIKKTLQKKFSSLLETITDENTKALMRENTIITGGCIASMFLGEDVNDYDLYFTDKETAFAVANYYVNQFNTHTGYDCKVLDEPGRIKIFIQSSGVAKDNKSVGTSKQENIKPEKFRPTFLSSNAITLSNSVQLVIRFYGKPEDIHLNYDFIHCTNYWLSSDGQLYTNSDALESLLTKTIHYSGSKYPLCSIIRTRKFIKRGWRINAGQYLKMCFQVSKLDLTDIKVLEEQLIGVDAAYFTTLIDALKKQKEKDNDFVISDGYISTLVDRIF